MELLHWVFNIEVELFLLLTHELQEANLLVEQNAYVLNVIMSKKKYYIFFFHRFVHHEEDR